MKRSRLLLLLALPFALELGLRVAARLLHRERGIVFDAELGWRMVPGVEKVGPFWSGTRPTLVNSRGWRDEELELERAPGRVRMVVVGDSYTFGVGVDPEQRFTEQLELLSPGLDVVNLGMNAVGPDQELLYLEQDGLPLAPAVAGTVVLTLGTVLAYPFEMDTIVTLSGGRLVATHYGFYNTLSGIGITIGNLATGLVWDTGQAHGWPWLVWVVLAATGAVGATALALLLRSGHLPTTEPDPRRKASVR